MKYRLFLAGLLSLLASFSLMAKPELELQHPLSSLQENQPSALSYLIHMQEAYKQLNYELLYINMKNKIEPKQLIHGLVNGERITYFRFLNGPMRESLQFDGKISFYEQGNQAYSLISQRDQSVFANIANFDFEGSDKSYEYIILGKGRIAGKKAIAIKMISKDEYRYSYIIWLDLKSYLPLRLDTISQLNLIIEQTMVTSLNVTENISPWIKKLSHQAIPEVLHFSKSEIESMSEWKVDWLPEGFQIIKDDQHKLMIHDINPVSYIMISDGLVMVSIYVSPKVLEVAEQNNIIQHGGTLLYTEQQNSIEVNIIGKIPLITAEKIAGSIRGIE